MPKKINGVNYNTHDDLLKLSGLSEAEKEEIKLNAQIATAIIKAREEKNITQQKLEEMSGVTQPLIARIENGKTEPRISTIIRLLEPLGKTLKVVPIEETKKRA